MRLYWELARRGYRRYSAYPAATVAGLFTNVFFGFLLAYILLAVYESADEIGGYDVRDAIAYVWVSQGLFSVIAVFGPSWFELALRVRSGDIATDLQRPLDLQHAAFAQDVGRAGYQLVYRALPQFVLGTALFEITVPGDVARWLLFAISVALAIAVSFGIRFVVNLCSFWLLDHRGPTLLALAVTSLLSGMVIPLAFYPGGLDTILRLLPFASMLQTPVDIYVGQPLRGSDALALALQAFWAVALYATGRLVLDAGMRKLVVQGG